MWEVAEPRNKKFKMFFQGPPGCFKTRLALRLADNGDRANPAAGVIDTEFGTDHYAGDFAFRIKQENDPDTIYKEVKKLVKNPGDIRTLIFDSFSVYYDTLMEIWVDRFQLREKTSAGNKGEYYTLQPRDYVHINRDAAKLVRMLLKCDLNIICICQIKEKWEGMKVVGSIFDGWKRLPYYFDTIVGIEEAKKDGWNARILGKDRSHSFKVGEVIPWESDDKIHEYMVKKMGQDLSGGDKAESFDPDVPEKKSESKLAADTAQSSTEKGKKDELGKEPATEPSKESTRTIPPEDKKATENPTDTSAGEQSKNDSPSDGQAAGDEAPESTEIAELLTESGPVTKDKLIEVVREKKKAKINNPDVWTKMLAKYNVKKAKEMTMAQADELIKDLIRREIPT